MKRASEKYTLMISVRTQRVLGILLILGGAGLTAWEWRILVNGGSYFSMFAFMAPAFAVIGIMQLCFPVDNAERLARGEQPIAKLYWKDMIGDHRILAGFAVFCGAVNWLLMWAYAKRLFRS